MKISNTLVCVRGKEDSLQHRPKIHIENLCLHIFHNLHFEAVKSSAMYICSTYGIEYCMSLNGLTFYAMT